MKRRYEILLGGTALAGLQAFAGPVMASDGVKLSLGGFLYTAYGVTFDDDEAGELGDGSNLDGISHDSEIFFQGEITLDNGLTVGAAIEIEGGDEDGDQFDQSYAYFEGGWGKFEIGIVDGIGGQMYMLPPGSTSNFGPYSPNVIGSVLSPGLFDPENSLTAKDKPVKMVYFSPHWGGFQFGLSYTPNDDKKTYDGDDNIDGTFHPNKPEGSASHNVGLALHYEHEGDGWGLNAGAAAYIEGDVNKGSDEDSEQGGYNAGVNLALGNWEFGVAGTFLDDGNGAGQDIWMVGTGLTYGMDAWTFGLGWAHVDSKVSGFSDHDTLDRAGVTVNYALGPGIAIDSGVFYTWAEAADDVDDPADAYDAIEFAIGTALDF